jgi:hypothetical protein
MYQCSVGWHVVVVKKGGMASRCAGSDCGGGQGGWGWLAGRGGGGCGWGLLAVGGAVVLVGVVATKPIRQLCEFRANPNEEIL